MGCDIHPVIQVRDPIMGWWKTNAIPDDGRWYLFFELLCGVRARSGFGGVMPSHRGLPEPVGRTMSYSEHDHEDFGDHSFTWWTLAEMKDAVPHAEEFCSTQPEWAASALERFKRWIALAEEVGRHHDAESDNDIRFVVGFDN